MESCPRFVVVLRGRVDGKGKGFVHVGGGMGFEDDGCPWVGLPDMFRILNDRLVDVWRAVLLGQKYVPGRRGPGET